MDEPTCNVDGYPTEKTLRIRKYLLPIFVFKLLVSIIILLALCSCGPKKNYQVPTRWKTIDCQCYFYAGECWNRYYGTMIDTNLYIPITDLDTGGFKAVRVTKLSRMIELRDKAYKISLESPSDAPLSEIWLVYSRIKYDLEKQKYTNQQENTVSITPRQRKPK